MIALEMFKRQTQINLELGRDKYLEIPAVHHLSFFCSYSTPVFPPEPYTCPSAVVVSTVVDFGTCSVLGKLHLRS
jgi:hypothetical protein